MSESNEKPASKPAQPKKELSMEHRLLLAFALMGVVLLVTQWVMPQPAPDVKQQAKTESKGQSEPPKAPAPPAASESKPAAAAAPAAPKATAATLESASISAAAEESSTIETALYKIVFTNRGALVKSWILKKYKDSAGKPLDLVNGRAIAKTGYPLSLTDGNARPLSALNDALYATRISDDKLRIEFEFSKGANYARKSFQFHSDSYRLEFSSAVRQDGKPKAHMVAWRGGFGDVTVIGAAANQYAVHYDIADQKLVQNAASDAEDAPVANRGAYTFAGLSDAYFAAVALPEASGTFSITALSDKVPNSIDDKEELHVGVALGGEAENSFTLFAGPKDLDLLKSISPRLVTLVDWGWFEIIAKPLFYALNWMNDKYIHNYGWTIVIITIIINFLVLPLKISSLKSMKHMQSLQPQLQAINEKYRGLSVRDPKKQQQNEEIMALYKKHGVNPMGGCVPMLLQIPFFFAFYKVLTVAIEMRGAEWLWVTDLSRPETLAIRILPVAMIGSQFVLQKMTPSTGDPSQQRIMLLMPLMLGFMFYGVSSGLVLYWLTGNLVGIAQQWAFNRMGPAAVAAPQSKAAARKSGKKA
jgi:YidC/Oxa1 family membrane protein insertase